MLDLGSRRRRPARPPGGRARLLGQRRRGRPTRASSPAWPAACRSCRPTSTAASPEFEDASFDVVILSQTPAGDAPARRWCCRRCCASAAPASCRSATSATGRTASTSPCGAGCRSRGTRAARLVRHAEHPPLHDPRLRAAGAGAGLRVDAPGAARRRRRRTAWSARVRLRPNAAGGRGGVRARIGSAATLPAMDVARVRRELEAERDRLAVERARLDDTLDRPRSVALAQPRRGPRGDGRARARRRSSPPSSASPTAPTACASRAAGRSRPSASRRCPTPCAASPARSAGEHPDDARRPLADLRAARGAAPRRLRAPGCWSGSGLLRGRDRRGRGRPDHEVARDAHHRPRRGRRSCCRSSTCAASRTRASRSASSREQQSVVMVLTVAAIAWMFVFFARSGARSPFFPPAVGLLAGGALLEPRRPHPRRRRHRLPAHPPLADLQPRRRLHRARRRPAPAGPRRSTSAAPARDRGAGPRRPARRAARPVRRGPRRASARAPPPSGCWATGRVLVDGEAPPQVVPRAAGHDGGRRRRRAGRPGRSSSHDEDVPFRIAYEDDALLVVDKPAGRGRAPGAGPHRRHARARPAGRGHRAAATRPTGPGIVHRLDRDTSGLLVVAKSEQVHAALGRAMRARAITREYAALVHGRPSARAGAHRGGDRPRPRQGPDGRRRHRAAAGGHALPGRRAAADHDPARRHARAPAGRTRSASTWRRSATRWWATRRTARPAWTATACSRQFLHACRLRAAAPGDGRGRSTSRATLPDDLVAALDRARRRASAATAAREGGVRFEPDAPRSPRGGHPPGATI